MRSWLKSMGGVLLLVAGAGAGGYGGHHVADGQSEAQVAALKEQLNAHIAQAATDKTDLDHRTRDNERDIAAIRSDYLVQLASVHTSIADMSESLRQIRDVLDQRGPVLTRYQPRRPPIDRHRVDPIDADSSP